MKERAVLDKPDFDPDFRVDRRYRDREWLSQVDFWEGIKESILKRIPFASRSIDQLY